MESTLNESERTMPTPTLDVNEMVKNRVFLVISTDQCIPF